MKNKLTIGLVGFGCVGSGLYEVLNQAKLIDARIKKIVVKDRTKSRSIPQENFLYDVNEILNDEEINVVVELINDSREAYEIVKTALLKGKHVVTANKKLLAESLPELIQIANEKGVSLLYEGAVAGAIPILRNLEEYYNNDTLTSIEGIVNGTTNYILTKSNDGIPYHEALLEAQEKGFAELNPTLDVDGYDAKFKLTILLKHAFGLTVSPEEIFQCGIRRISSEAVEYAKGKGYRIKLFAKAEKSGNEVVGFVAPYFVRADHFAYDVHNEFNAVIVQGLFADRQLFVGKGAGSYPTASAVLSDISALKFDYRYEYKKSETGEVASLTDKVLAKVFVGANSLDEVNRVPFVRIDEVLKNAEYAYQIGWVKLADLKQINFNEDPSLSLVFMPEEFKSVHEIANGLNENIHLEIASL